MSPLVRVLVLLLLAFAPDASAADDPGAGPFEVRGPATTEVWELEAPAVAGDQYAVTGSVAYEGVEGDGFLEMWSEFPDGSRYFSRTLGESGPMAKLRGSSAARPFVLPFFLTPDFPRPVRLEVNVVLPAAGRVVLRELRFGSGAESTRLPGAWWSPQTGGWIGGGAGGATGLVGALIGTLCALGRGRRIVLGGLLALGVSGLVLLAVGGVALALGQPYEVWYPLLLLGVLDPVLGFSLLEVARRRFEELELRRTQALDAR